LEDDEAFLSGLFRCHSRRFYTCSLLYRGRKKKKKIKEWLLGYPVVRSNLVKRLLTKYPDRDGKAQDTQDVDRESIVYGKESIVRRDVVSQFLVKDAMSTNKVLKLKRKFGEISDEEIVTLVRERSSNNKGLPSGVQLPRMDRAGATQV
jgi:hypothetical protein